MCKRICAKIYESDEYFLFELLLFNRDVEKIDKLIESMQRYGFLAPFPIYVVRNGRGKLLIKAGHHRFEAAKKLGIPIKYTFGPADVSIYDLEAGTEQWVLRHYLTANVREGKRDYDVVKQYHERTGITLGQSISLIGGESAGSSNKQTAFKRGRFQVGDVAHAALIEDVVSYLKGRCNVSFATNSIFVNALSKVCRVEQFDVGRFKKKARTHRHIFDKQRSVEDYVELIEQIYNRQTSNKVPLAFWANETARQRSVGRVG